MVEVTRPNPTRRTARVSMHKRQPKPTCGLHGAYGARSLRRAYAGSDYNVAQPVWKVRAFLGILSPDRTKRRLDLALQGFTERALQTKKTVNAALQASTNLWDLDGRNENANSFRN